MNMRSRLTQGPNFPPAEKLRLYVYGLPGTTKTHFCASIPESILIDIEGESGFVLSPHAKSIIPEDGKDFGAIIEWLVEDGPSKTGFSRVSIDSIDALVLMAIPWRTDLHNAEQRMKRPPGRTITDMREFGQSGAGWGKVNDHVLSYSFYRLRAAGYGLTITGQGKTETIEIQTPHGATTKTVLRPLVNDGIRNRLFQYTQFCGKTRYSTKKVMRERRSSESGKTATSLVTERCYEIDLSAPESSVSMDAIVKARLVPFMADDSGTIRIDVTGPNGWGAFVKRYETACTRAKESLISGAPAPERKETTNGND